MHDGEVDYLERRKWAEFWTAPNACVGAGWKRSEMLRHDAGGGTEILFAWEMLR